ncbi:hypothetical protein KBD71_01150 [Candidatus Woesebacteria bacterium]|nr:hypothetical protein [Candidatus Woesebacteria bacterium]
MDRETRNLEEVRRSNREKLEKAFAAFEKQVLAMLDTSSENEPTVQLYSEPFELIRTDGKLQRFKIRLKPLNLQKRNFSIDVDIVDAKDLTPEANRSVYTDPTGEVSIDSIRRKLDLRTVEYWSEIKIIYESLKSVGVGSALLDQSEKLVISIWEKIGPSKNIDTLQIILRDRSNPPMWTSRQAEKSGYLAAGTDKEGDPRFKKEISLSKRRSRLRGLLGRFSD